MAAIRLQDTWRDHLGQRNQLWIDPHRVDGTADPYATLTKIDVPFGEPTEQHFYHGPNGSIISRDQPYPPDEVRRLGLTVISRKEAWSA